MVFRFILIAFLYIAAPLRADIPFFWLDRPSGRNNPADPSFRGPASGLPTLPAPTPTPTSTPVFKILRAFGVDAAPGSLSQPAGAVVNPSNQLVVADHGDALFKVFDLAGGTLVDSHPIALAWVGGVIAGSMEVDDLGNYFLCNAGKVQKYDPSFSLSWTSAPPTPVAGIVPISYSDIAWHSSGSLHALDGNGASSDEKYCRINAMGTWAGTTVVSSSTSNGLGSVDLDPSGNLRIYSTYLRQFRVYDSLGIPQSYWGDTNPYLPYVRGMVFLPDGRVVVAQIFGLWVYDSAGNYQTSMVSTFSPYGAWGNIVSIVPGTGSVFYVVDQTRQRVYEMSP